MKQKRFKRLNAFIPVYSLADTLAYYRDSLGFGDEWIIGTDGGISRDDMHMIFCQEPNYVQAINNGVYRFVFFWFVDCIDAIYREFKEERKLAIVDEIADRPWGVREFSIYDNNGYLIRVSEEINH